MIEVKRILPLGTSPGQEFEHNPADFTHGQSYYEFLLKNPGRNDLLSIPISSNYLKGYIESVIPDGRFPGEIIDLYSPRHKTFYLLRHPQLKDEVILGYDRCPRAITCESAIFSLRILRDFDQKNGKFKLENKFMMINGVAYISGTKPRLLHLSYSIWREQEKLRIDKMVMSLTPEEAPRFSRSHDLDPETSQQITDIEPYKSSADFTTAMTEEVKHSGAVIFSTDSTPNYYHPRRLGTFLEVHGNQVTFGLKVFRNETASITVPYTLRKPKEIRIPLSR